MSIVDSIIISLFLIMIFLVIGVAIYEQFVFNPNHADAKNQCIEDFHELRQLEYGENYTVDCGYEVSSYILDNNTIYSKVIDEWSCEIKEKSTGKIVEENVKYEWYCEF